MQQGKEYFAKRQKRQGGDTSVKAKKQLVNWDFETEEDPPKKAVQNKTNIGDLDDFGLDEKD